MIPRIFHVYSYGGHILVGLIFALEKKKKKHYVCSFPRLVYLQALPDKMEISYKMLQVGLIPSPVHTKHPQDETMV